MRRKEIYTSFAGKGSAIQSGEITSFKAPYQYIAREGSISQRTVSKAKPPGARSNSNISAVEDKKTGNREVMTRAIGLETNIRSEVNSAQHIIKEILKWVLRREYAARNHGTVGGRRSFGRRGDLDFAFDTNIRSFWLASSSSRVFELHRTLSSILSLRSLSSAARSLLKFC